VNREAYRRRANRLATVITHAQRRILRYADIAADDPMLYRRVMLPPVVREARRIEDARRELRHVNNERRLDGAFAAKGIKDDA
jgi:hypothetical protein